MNRQGLNINKLIIINKDKTPEKKNNLKSVNSSNRLPSATAAKVRNSFSVNQNNNNSNYKTNNLFYSNNRYDHNIFIDDTNYQIFDLNVINKSSIINNLMGLTGKDNLKEIITNEVLNNHHINKSTKFAQSSKNISSYMRNGIKGVKLRRDSGFNMTNKITINAKLNEINKSNK